MRFEKFKWLKNFFLILKIKYIKFKLKNIFFKNILLLNI
jgi:hypothetical protein